MSAGQWIVELLLVGAWLGTTRRWWRMGPGHLAALLESLLLGIAVWLLFHTGRWVVLAMTLPPALICGAIDKVLMMRRAEAAARHGDDA